MKKPLRKPRKYPRGVYKDTPSGPFKAKLYEKGKFIYLGSFNTPEEAHKRYMEEKQSRKQEFELKTKREPLPQLKGTPFYGL